MSRQATPSKRRESKSASHLFNFAAAAAIIAAAVFSAPLRADPSDDAARANASGTAGANVTWMSGGIGEEARDEMRRSAGAYNVHLVFSRPDGAYLAEVPFSVARSDGTEIYSGVSDGPLLYLKLRPGTYRVTAQINGVTQTKQVSVGSAQAARVSFVAR